VAMVTNCRIYQVSSSLAEYELVRLKANGY
jgi:hypothetical protein